MTHIGSHTKDFDMEEYGTIEVLAKTDFKKLTQIDGMDDVVDYLNGLEIQLYFADLETSKFVEFTPDSSYLRKTDIRALQLYDGDIGALVEREGGLQAASFAIPVIMIVDYNIVIDWGPNSSMEGKYDIDKIKEDIKKILSGQP